MFKKFIKEVIGDFFRDTIKPELKELKKQLIQEIFEKVKLLLIEDEEGEEEKKVQYKHPPNA